MFSGEITKTDGTKLNSDAEPEETIDLGTLAMQSAAEMISSTIAKCEFKTLILGKEMEADEYYLWNYQPNVNQNGAEFKKELINRLILYNEALVVPAGNQLIVADGYYKQDNGIQQDTFVGVYKGVTRFEQVFQAKDVLFFKLSDRNMRVHLDGILDQYSALLTETGRKYTQADGIKGTLQLPTTQTGDPESRDKRINQSFQHYYRAKNAVLQLPRGSVYEEHINSSNRAGGSEITDFTSLSDAIFGIAAQSARIPPALLRGDVADIEALTSNFMTFCIEPICALLETETNCKRYGKKAVLERTMLKIDTTHINHFDVFAMADRFDKLIASGGYSIDELRTKAGDLPLGTAWSKRHWITRNYEGVNQQKEKEQEEQA